MDGSGNQNGWQLQDHNGQRWRWAKAVQWGVGHDCYRQSGAVGGDARRMAAAVTMDGSSKITMDSGSSNGQWRRNGWQNNEAILMGDGISMARMATMTPNGNDDAKLR
jgi:hypothetical protein